MKEKIDLKFKYRHKLLNFKSFAKYVSVPSDIHGILKDLTTGEETSYTLKFKLDTGADITILNQTCESLISKMKPIDELPIVYGSGTKQKLCPVYQVGIIIQGTQFEITALYDESCPFLLLGHYKFLEYNNYTLFDSSLKRTTIYRF